MIRDPDAHAVLAKIRCELVTRAGSRWLVPLIFDAGYLAGPEVEDWVHNLQAEGLLLHWLPPDSHGRQRAALTPFGVGILRLWDQELRATAMSETEVRR